MLRQHLNDDQRAVLAKLWRDRRSDQLKHERATRAATEQPQTSVPGAASKKKRDSRAESCEKFNVPERTLRRIMEISRHRPEALNQIFAGAVSSYEVMHEIRRVADQKRADAAETITVKACDLASPALENNIHCGDAVEVLKRVGDGTASLVLTSPPYPGVAIKYEPALEPLTYAESLDCMEQVLVKSLRVLRPGGRVAWNIDTVRNKEGGQHYMHPIITDMVGLAAKVGLNYWNDIAWAKGEVSGSKTAFGSFAHCSCPILNRNHEWVLLFYKGDAPTLEGDKTLCDLRREEYMKWWTSTWDIMPEVRLSVRGHHPAPFPDELAARLIKLFTYRRDLVIDPFSGSGTTSICASRLGRRYIGIDRSEEYCRFARARIADATAVINWQSIRQTDYPVIGRIGPAPDTSLGVAA